MRMLFPRCLLQAVQTLVQPYYLTGQPTATLWQTHKYVVLEVSLHESLFNIKMAQVKIQLARHSCPNRTLETAAVGENKR